MSQGTLENGLPRIHRFVTDHNPDGQAIFSSRLDETMPWQNIQIANFALGYTTSEFPAKLNDERDIAKYEQYLENKPGIAIPGGTVLRIVDVPPSSLSPMHRTVSLDYGVVLEGEFELILDSGEKRVMRRGDISIQRGTNHAWRNTSNTSWGRMMYVLQEAEPIAVDGKLLGEDYGSGMPGVPSSEHR